MPFAIGIYTSREMPDFGAFLPLLLTQEGGEGWGEEARFVEIPLSPPLSPFLAGGEGTCVDTNDVCAGGCGGIWFDATELERVSAQTTTPHQF